MFWETSKQNKKIHKSDSMDEERIRLILESWLGHNSSNNHPVLDGPNFGSLIIIPKFVYLLDSNEKRSKIFD